MSEKKCYKILKFLHFIVVLLVSSFFVNSSCNIRSSHGNESENSNGIVNIRYDKYNPYEVIEKEVNNGNISYKTTILVEEYTEDNVNKNASGTNESENVINVNIINDGQEVLIESDEDALMADDVKQSLGKKQGKKKRRHNISIGFNVSTLGIGGNVSYNYWLFGIRFSGDFLKLSLNGFVKNYLDFDLNSYNFGLSVLVRPSDTGFYINIGFFYLNHNILGKYNMDFSSSKTSAVYSTMLLGLYFRKGIVPYFGLGWDFNISNNFFISIDVGVLVTGKLRYNTLAALFHASGGFADNYRIDGLEDVLTYDDVKRLLGPTFTNILDKLVVWPVVKVGLNYRFNL